MRGREGPGSRPGLGLLSRLGRLGRLCACFEAGTLVATPDGLRRIEEIAVGDQVLAWNSETRRDDHGNRHGIDPA
ncbi:MAG: Hint domain-containing protein [Hyphomonadaceae bacterium]